MSLCSTTGRFEFAAGTAFTAAIRLVAAVFIALAVAGSALANDRWLRNFDDAMRAAEQTGRPVLTIFTGSDWCPHCVTLEKKVLDSQQFLAWAENRVVLLMIDLPQQGISQEERHARSRVCIKYGVRTFPNTVLIAPDGAKIMAQSGYHGQTPEAWLATMEKHVPAPVLAENPEDEERILSSIDEAVETARDSRKPVLLLVSTPLPCRLFKCNSFEPTSTKLVVTEADIEKRIVRELNAEPAAREYARIIGVHESELSAYVFAAHPVIVRVGGDYYARSIQRANEDGSLTFFCAIDEGLVLTAAGRLDTLGVVEQMFRDTERELGEVALYLGFDCLHRKLDAEQRQIIRDMEDLYRRHNVVGFNTYGEQFETMHLNQTFAGVAIGKRSAG